MRRLAIVAGLVVAVLAVYAQAARFDFVEIDDPAYVRDNGQVLSGLSPSGIAWAFTTNTEANWHPLTWISLMADTSLGGPGPAVYHVTNVALHALCVLLLFLLFERLTGSSIRSALVAALFAVHPLHVESVAWIAERKDVLSTAFGLLALHAWLSARLRPKSPMGLAALALYAASLMSKPMLVSLPLLMLLLEAWPLARPERLSARIVEKIPWFAMAAASCAVTWIVQAQGGAARTLTQYPWSGRAGNALVAYARYLVHAVRPEGLAAFYPYAYGGLPAWQVLGSLAALMAVTAASAAAWRRAPYLLVGWLWYLVSLVPVIGLVQVGAQAMADRYTYVPLVGPFLMVVWGISDLAASADATRRRWIEGAAAAVALAILLTLGVAAHRQAATWRDSVTVFEHALAVTDDNAVAHGALATALFRRGELDRAVAQCRAALAIAPDMGDVQSNLVRGLIAQGHVDEAAALAQEFAAKWPDDPRAHVNLGLVAMVRGDLEAAALELEGALRLAPSNADAHANLGALLLRQGRRPEALSHLEAAARLRPSDARIRAALEKARAAGSASP